MQPEGPEADFFVLELEAASLGWDGLGAPLLPLMLAEPKISSSESPTTAGFWGAAFFCPLLLDADAWSQVSVC